MSIDPRVRKYPYLSPYCFAANNPIYFIDYNGEGPEVPITYEQIKAAFNDGKKATGYGFTLYVNQPTPGTGDTHDGIDVGHTFIKLIKFNEDGTRTEQIFGFYPEESVVMPIFDDNSKGQLGNDENHDFNVKVTKTGITKKQFDAVLELANVYEQKTYNLSKCNCTDFGIEAARLVDVEVPDTKGDWPGGEGSNPGSLGKDIIDKQAEIANKKKNVTVTVNPNGSRAKAKNYTTKTPVKK